MNSEVVLKGYIKLFQMMEDILVLKNGLMIDSDQKGKKLLIQENGLEKEEVKITKKKSRRRRMTPVPNNNLIVVKQLNRRDYKKRYLSVEEEDADDLESYDKESDYVHPGLPSIENERSKRFSWHGECLDQEDVEVFRRGVGLSKSNSLDRGMDNRKKYNIRRKHYVVSPFVALDTKSNSSLSESSISSDEDLPAWMKLASLEDRKNERDDEVCHGKNDIVNTKRIFNEKYAEDSRRKELRKEKNNNMENTEKGSELDCFKSFHERHRAFQEKESKEKQQYSERRKELRKQKNLSEKRRQRKITPSKNPPSLSESLRKRFSSSSMENMSISESEIEE